MKNKIMIATALLVATFSLTACQQTDVIANQAIQSFDKILKVDSNSITKDAASGAYALLSPAGTEQFIWGKNTQIEFDIDPFIKAGLDVDKLPIEMVSGEKLSLTINNNNFNNQDTPSSAFENFVRNNRSNIAYHTALDHFGVSFGDGNAFEWAKEMTTNDKDIVFVLNPQTFRNAGVDVQNVEGWVLGKVIVMDDKGKKSEVEKAIKAI